MNCDVIKLCYQEMTKVRGEIEAAYGKNEWDIMGKCIEASDKLVKRLKSKGLDAQAYQVWALYECFETCTSQCFEEHWIVLVRHKGKRIYLDPTYNQFQWAMNQKLPKVYIGTVLPNWLLPRKPSRKTLKKCGWTDFYNGRTYENEFNYYI